jgi:ribosomal protein S18 acetylase RimI-like enzyme
MSDAGAAVVVRAAAAVDVDRVAALFDAYRQFYGAESDVAAARTFLADRLARDESVVLVALASHDGGDPDLAGFAQLYRSFSSVSLGRIVILNDLYVDPAWRRSGVARRLVDEATAWATRSGAIRLELATQHTNRSARALYDALGFVADTEFAHLSLALRRT